MYADRQKCHSISTVPNKSESSQQHFWVAKIICDLQFSFNWALRGDSFRGVSDAVRWVDIAPRDLSRGVQPRRSRRQRGDAAGKIGEPA